jgi:hypothetical protein
VATAYLASKITATSIMKRYVNATPANLGVAVGTAVTHSTPGGRVNGAIRWDGAIYKVAGDGIHRSIDDGTSYVLVQAFTLCDTAGTWGAPFAIHVVHSAGVPRIVALYINTSGSLRYVVSLTGVIGTWTDTNTATSIFSINYSFVYRGTIAFHATAAGSAVLLDPVGGSLTTISTLNTANTYIYAWGDILYVSGRFSGLQFQLRSLAGGVSTNLLNIAAFDQTGWRCAFVDPATGNIIQIVLDTTSLIVKAFEITPVLGVTDRTSTMITGSNLATFTTTSCTVAGVFIDQDSTPGAAPTIYLLIASNSTAGTAVSMFKFNGVSTKMGDGSGNPNDSGGDIADSFPDKNIGGERFFTARSVGVDGVPEVIGSGVGGLGVALTRRKFKLSAPRSQVLTTLGGAATYNLAGAALASLPVRSGYTTIKGVIGAASCWASDQAIPGVLVTGTQIAAGSNGQVLPQATINAVSVGGFPPSGTIRVTTSMGVQTVTYTGLGALTFTGCTGGVGTMSTGGAIEGGLLPNNGTVDYTTGAMTGTTATLDAASQVEALYVGGTAKVQWYRSLAATNPYPASTTKAPLTLPTSGTISGDDNITCLANGSEQQVSVGMSGFTAGDRVALNPRALP